MFFNDFQIYIYHINRLLRHNLALVITRSPLNQSCVRHRNEMLTKSKQDQKTVRPDEVLLVPTTPSQPLSGMIATRGQTTTWIFTWPVIQLEAVLFNYKLLNIKSISRQP